MWSVPSAKGRFRRRSKAGRHRREERTRKGRRSRRWLRPAMSRSRLTRRRARPRKAVPRGPPPPGLRREYGRAARHPGGGLARPGEKPGSVRTHLRRRSPRGQSLKGRQAPKREARDQRRRAGGLVRLKPVERDPSFPSHPRAHARRARARATASRTPSGFADALRIIPSGRQGREDKTARSTPRDRPRAWPRRPTAPRSCPRSGSGRARSHRRGR
jgi:hypothetical protein